MIKHFVLVSYIKTASVMCVADLLRVNLRATVGLNIFTMFIKKSEKVEFPKGLPEKNSQGSPERNQTFLRGT